MQSAITSSDVTSLASIAPAYPELVLAIGAVALLLIALFWKNARPSVIAGISIVLLLVVLAVLVLRPGQGTGSDVLFNGIFIVDGFARYMKALVLGGAAFILLISISSAKAHGLDKFEYSILTLLATLGMMIMVSANDLMSLYVGLELQSLALYVVAAMKRDDSKATEAGLKYFVLGALSSGMLLYGASLVYGFTGTTQIDQIVTAITAENRSIGLIFGMVFLLAGIAFKISAVPFHMWTPDVYEGAPTPVTAFFAAAPKVAAMALFVRVTMVSFKGVTDDWQQIVIFLSIVSPTFRSILFWLIFFGRGGGGGGGFGGGGGSGGSGRTGDIQGPSGPDAGLGRHLAGQPIERDGRGHRRGAEGDEFGRAAGRSAGWKVGVEAGGESRGCGSSLAGPFDAPGTPAGLASVDPGIVVPPGRGCRLCGGKLGARGGVRR
jgi:hypothetical protein